jgi:tripartite-type tricarboxylate transporter receptor subunit TctC
MRLGRRSLLAAPALLALPARAQGWAPERPVRILIPYTPGAINDALGRLVGERFQDLLGQPGLVENRPGASGSLALAATAQAAPDGHTIVVANTANLCMNPFLFANTGYDSRKDLAPIAVVARVMNVLVVKADGPHRSVPALIAAAKADPGKLTFSTSGIATTNPIALEELCEREGVSMTHIPFRGSQEGVTALLGKQIDIVADSQSWRPNVENGELRLLSVWTRERLKSIPDAPTLRDLGYDMVVTSPYGIVGPKGMDPEIVEILHRSMKKGYEDPTTQAIFDRWENPREYLGPADYLAFVKDRVAYEKRMVAKLGLSID